MLFRIVDIYKQSKELRRNPVQFVADGGRALVAPMFVIPAVMVAVCAVVCAALWYWVGWGVFLVAAIVSAVLLLGIAVAHRIALVLLDKLQSRADSVYADMGEQYTKGSSKSTDTIDVTAEIVDEE